ncbi:M23 family metallopeptidase [Novosphingobium aquimarinum]|uniref:M23 family metallopeptidase n=1 Tax=Novosphingobium aquimarinum TaxID=2682494 RepID=UPI0012EB7008|nr:M23 family metallopeptidase [Novosphingobium aquimarinum]
MVSSSGNDANFDPRTWLKSGDGLGGGAGPDSKEGRVGTSDEVAAPDEFAAGQASFDPRTWGGDGSPTGAEKATAATAALHQSRRFGLALAGLLACGVMAGGLLFWSSHAPVSDLPAVTGSDVPPAAGSESSNSAPQPQTSGESLRTLKLASSQDVASSLRAAGIDADMAEKASALVREAIAPGTELDLEFALGEGERLLWLAAMRPDGSGTRITASVAGLRAQPLAVAVKRKVTVVRGELDTDSFYSSAVSAGVVDSLISDFANAFAFDFDLQREVSPGDIFEVAFAEKVNARGERVGRPELLYVSLATEAKSKELYRFAPPGQTKPGWFDANGVSTVKAFMRTPIDGARITSKFGMRFHPVLKYNRLHGGTDFAAPVGTPIYAAAQGRIISASPSRCAGNMVIIAHESGYETRYFHLSRYAEGARAGQQVAQGTTIGYVGNTGTCTTGPHLHYEVHIQGKKVDPLSIDTGKSERLEGNALKAFFETRDAIDVARADAAT